MPTLNNEHILGLQEARAEFLGLLKSVSDEDFFRKIPEKWTAAQHVQHLVLSIQPVNWGLRLPRLLLRWLFGKIQRPSYDYSGLQAAYQLKLHRGAKSPVLFVPKAVRLDQRAKIEDSFVGATNQLIALAEQLDEHGLDHFLLPHPLLGKITIREMLFFCAFHIRIHQAAIARDLKK
jgi:hypothetical protein